MTVLSSELEYLPERGLPDGPRGAPRVHDGRAPAARHPRHAARCARSCGPAAPTSRACASELKEFIDADDARASKHDDDREVQPTLGFQRVLQRAVFHVQSSGKKEVTVANVLVAIFSEKQSHAAYLLSLQDVTRLDVVNLHLARPVEVAARSARTRARTTPPTEGEREARAARRAREVHDQSQRAGAATGASTR